MRAISRGRLLTACALAAALAAALAVGLARGGTTHARCTHGVSSIGPVELAGGKVVGGSLTPHTQACLR